MPEEVRNAIYDDMRWFDRAKYLPEGSDEDPLMYVSKELDKGLRELTELQREILFRTVIKASPPNLWLRTNSVRPEISVTFAAVRCGNLRVKSPDAKAPVLLLFSFSFCFGCLRAISESISSWIGSCRCILGWSMLFMQSQ